LSERGSGMTAATIKVLFTNASFHCRMVRRKVILEMNVKQERNIE